MHYTCRSFIGHSLDDSWCQFWENEPDDPTLVSSRGHLFGLVSFSAHHYDVSTLGHQLIIFINEGYFQVNSTPVNLWLKDILNQIENHPDFKFPDLALTLAVVVEGQLYLATLNSGNSILARGNNISLILQGQPNSVVEISGNPKADDKLFICTDSFFHQFTWSKIKSFLASPSLAELEENFLGLLYSFNSQDHLAGALIQIHEDNLESEVEQAATEDIDPEPPPVFTSHQPVLPKIVPNSTPTYVGHHEPVKSASRRRINILVSILILIALCFSSYLGYRQNKSRLAEKNYQDVKKTLTAKINDAYTIKNINLDDASKLAKDAQKILNQISSSTTHQDEVKQFQNQIQALLSQTGSADNYSPALFFDTSLITQSPQYRSLYLSNSNLYLLDSSNGRLDSLDITNKSHQNVSSAAELKNASSLAKSGDTLYFLQGTNINELQKTGVTSKVDLSTEVKGFTSGSIGFWNGSLYLLAFSSSTPTIWRFAPNSTGFAPGSVWLKDKETLASDPTSFAINGDIWVLSKSGVITPYTHGAHVDFKESPNSLKSATNLVTSLDSDVLAFTEGDSQVYVYRKTGQSLGRYNFGTKKILSLAYDQNSNQILALCTDQKIYKISL